MATSTAVDEQFLELICSDEELLQAEFDAILAAEWPGPPHPTAGGGWTARHRGERLRRAGTRIARVRKAPGPLNVPARQRSPPSDVRVPTDAPAAGSAAVGTAACRRPPSRT